MSNDDVGPQRRNRVFRRVRAVGLAAHHQIGPAVDEHGESLPHDRMGVHDEHATLAVRSAGASARWSNWGVLHARG
jgi:hypothetical protein